MYARSRLLWNSVSRRVVRGSRLHQQSGAPDSLDRGRSCSHPPTGHNSSTSRSRSRWSCRTRLARKRTTYTFEVASDVAFTTKVQTKRIVEGSSGQTSARLDALPA